MMNVASTSDRTTNGEKYVRDKSKKFLARLIRILLHSERWFNVIVPDVYEML